MFRIIAFLTVVRLSAGQFSAPSATTIASIKADLMTQMRSNSAHLPTALRLSFHDCVGDACDGCINLANGSNDGLANVITFLETLYTATATGYNNIMSRADFWQLASIAAIEQGIVIANRRSPGSMPDSSGIEFKWGRTDCATSPTTTDLWTFPSPTMSRTEMMTYFSNAYGFTEDEVVALMGAHTLGGAARADSGYAGVWTAGEGTTFNTAYYSYIVNDQLFKGNILYTNRAVSRRTPTDRKWQWTITEESTSTTLGFMLNTDMELAYDIDVNASTGTTCSIGVDCPEASTIALSRSFSEDPTAFMTAFKSVYEKLISHGYTSLTTVV